MKISEGVEWAVHCCSLLANLPEGMRLSKARLAEFFDLRQHYLAKFMQKLSTAGIVQSSRGGSGGYYLAKPAAAISMLDIVEAVEGKKEFFRCTEIRQCGPTRAEKAAYKRPCGIARTMWRAEKAWRDELSRTSLQEIQMLGSQETPPEQLAKSANWLREAVS